MSGGRIVPAFEREVQPAYSQSGTTLCEMTSPLPNYRSCVTPLCEAATRPDQHLRQASRVALGRSGSPAHRQLLQHRCGRHRTCDYKGRGCPAESHRTSVRQGLCVTSPVQRLARRCWEESNPGQVFSAFSLLNPAVTNRLWRTLNQQASQSRAVRVIASTPVPKPASPS